MVAEQLSWELVPSCERAPFLRLVVDGRQVRVESAIAEALTLANVCPTLITNQYHNHVMKLS